MSDVAALPTATSGTVPLAIVMISYNEAHNMDAVLRNVGGFAQQVFLVDSYSTDATVDLALAHGAYIVQRPFKGFGDQWTYAVTKLPIKAPWTMKLDPDERLTDELKSSIRSAIRNGPAAGFAIERRLWFMGVPLPVRQRLVRIWRTGTSRFSEVAVNEHPIVSGRVLDLPGDLEHHDSPNLHHWYDKQNRYSTAEALARFNEAPLAFEARLFGTPLERRMWIKANINRIPLRYLLLHFYHLFALGAWRAGSSGFAWARLRTEVYRMRDLKLRELRRLGVSYQLPDLLRGAPHPRAHQAAE